LEKAGGAGGFIFAAQGEGFGGVETAVVVFFVDGLDAWDAERGARGAAGSGGEIFRGAGVGEELPDVVAIVEEK
jgi:hypothetical protein